jgi:CO/xanthine dehydrogenase FAD-binding subunit
MNPYASHLGDRDPLSVIAASPLLLAAQLDRLGPDGIERPYAPGKWNTRQILCHLADTELVFAFRLRQTLAEDHHVVQPMDQDKWAANYDAFGARAAFEVFTAVRKWNLALLAVIPPALMSKPVTHPERGPMTFQVLVETMAGHDLNHLKQLESIA